MRKTNGSADLKNKILSVAWRLFRIYGYEKTTYQMIADEIGISKSSISYYFESKSLILSYHFLNSTYAIHEYIDTYLADETNAYLRICIAQICFYREILERERVAPLFFHTENMHIVTHTWISVIEDHFQKISDNFNKDFTAEEIHMAAIMSIGARVSVFNEFSHSQNLSIDRCCYYFVYLTGVLSRLDEATIQKNISRAFDFVNTHDLSDIFPEE